MLTDLICLLVYGSHKGKFQFDVKVVAEVKEHLTCESGFIFFNDMARETMLENNDLPYKTFVCFQQ